MATTITKCTSTVNTTACTKRTPKYIVVHYTAGTKSTVGHAKSVAQMFAKTSTKASADFIVDDGSIVQYNPDPTKRYTWAVGGSKYTTMTTNEGGKYYGKATNANSVNVELCSSKKSTKTLNASDTDWYFTDATIKNGVQIVKYLMSLYNIPVSNVIMHHHVTGKVCPNPFCVNQSALTKWNAFKNQLSATTSVSNKQSKYVYNNIDYSLVFDPQYYYNKYTDLQSGIGSDAKKLFNHFCIYGMKEGRQAIATFNVVVYKATYSDLQKAYGNDLPSYYKHYVQFGKAEGRKAY